MRRWRMLPYVGRALLVLASAGLLYLASVRFTYYDNGQWVKTNLLVVYAHSAAGYGTKAIEERRLPPKWGRLAGYAARNFSLDLVGLDYSAPLSWEDIAAGPGLNVMRKTDRGERVAVAIYPMATVGAGQKMTLTVRGIQNDPEPARGGTRATPLYLLTLYRPRFSSVAYVTKVDEIKPGSIVSEAVPPDGEPPSYNRMFDFALGLFKESFAADGRERNVLVSPYSVTDAFAMACAGADGDTRETMARVLGLSSATPDEILERKGDYRSYLTGLGPDIDVEVANSVWMTNRGSIRFKPRFVESCRDLLGAETRAVDFSDPGTVGLINAWVKEKTEGKIPSIVDNLEKGQVAALVNAVYMEAAWQYPFNPQVTKKAPFRLATGDTVECDMMSIGGTFKYLEADGFRAIRFPYGKGQMAMYLFLPDGGSSLEDFVGGVTTAKWRQWMEDLQPVQAKVQLPRFSFEYGANLNQALTTLGMGMAFDPVKADFSAMCEASQGIPVYIGSVNHKTFISVDEEGTEAAASTYIGIVGNAPPEHDVELTFDHPFAFAIRDERDGSLLFVGTVIRPHCPRSR